VQDSVRVRTFSPAKGFVWLVSARERFLLPMSRAMALAPGGAGRHPRKRDKQNIWFILFS
jgi:hypothetical protein